MALVTHYWAPHVGGIETVAREQAQRLADLGWHIEVFTTRMRDDAAKSADGKVIVRRYRCVNWQERRLRLPVPLPSPVMLSDLRRYASTADLVVAHGHCYLGSIIGAHAARVARQPLVVVQSSPFVDYPQPLAAIERIVDRTVGRWVLERARIVICVSKHVERHVRQIAPRASTGVIYSGVEIERFRPGGSVGSAGSADPATAPGVRSGLRVLTLRRLVPRNGVDVLVTAWRSAALGQDATLTIAGAGPERTRLKRLAAGIASVRFLGHVPDEHLPDLYRSADLFVLPSVSGEGFGIAAAEALASGVPVIATTGGAAAELVRHGQDGLIVPARDPQALARAIEWLAANPAILRRMAIAASQRRPQLSWRPAIERLAATLDSAVLARGATPRSPPSPRARRSEAQRMRPQRMRHSAMELPLRTRSVVRSMGRHPIRVASAACALALAGYAAASPAWTAHQIAISLNPQPAHYSEIFFDNLARVPTRLAPGVARKIPFAIVNREGRTFTYSYSVVVATARGHEVMQRGQAKVRDNEKVVLVARFVPILVNTSYIVTIKLDKPAEFIEFHGRTT